MLVIVYFMTCVCDAVMLYSIGLYDMLIWYCMLICIYAYRAGLLCLIGRDSVFWPRGSGLRKARRNVFRRGRFTLNDSRNVSMVNRVFA